MRKTLCLFLLTSGCACAGIIYQYPFTTDSDFNPSVVDPNVAFGNPALSHANSTGEVTDDGFGIVFQAYPPNLTGTDTAALTNDAYFYIDVSLNPGFVMDLTSLTFDVGKGGDTGPRGYLIRSDADSFASNIVDVNLTGNQAAPVFSSIDLSGSQYQDLSSIEFRFYIFTPTEFNSVDWNNITLNGDVVASAVPEPGGFVAGERRAGPAGAAPLARRAEEAGELRLSLLRSTWAAAFDSRSPRESYPDPAPAPDV